MIGVQLMSSPETGVVSAPLECRGGSVTDPLFSRDIVGRVMSCGVPIALVSLSSTEISNAERGESASAEAGGGCPEELGELMVERMEGCGSIASLPDTPADELMLSLLRPVRSDCARGFGNT